MTGFTLPKELSSPLLYVVAGVTFAASAAYQFGYWLPFHIDIFSFLGTDDVIKAAVVPVMGGLLAMALGAFLGAMSPVRDALPPGAGRHTPIGVWMNRHMNFLFLLWCLMGLALLVLFAEERPQVWYVLAMFIAVPTTVYSERIDWVRAWIPNHAARTVIVGLVASCLPYSYANARLKADAIQKGNEFHFLVPTAETVLALDPLARPRFLGHVGGYVFLFEPRTNTVAIQKFDEKVGLRVGYYKRPKETVGKPVALAASGPASNAADAPASSGSAQLVPHD